MSIDFTPDPQLYPFESRWFDSSRGRIHYVDEGTGPPILLCHGNPTWSFLYRDIIVALRDRFRCVAPDYLGFGLSERPSGFGYQIDEHARVIGEFVDHLGLDRYLSMGQDWGGPISMAVAVERADRVRGVVLAHDMGTSVTTELLARDLDGRLPFDLRRAVLSNGSVILERASLRPIQKVLRSPLGPVAARLVSRGGFTRGFGRIFSPAHPLSAQEAQAQWELLCYNDGNRIPHLLISYLDERIRHAQRWHGAVRDWPKPLGFVWGLDDPVATTNVLNGLRELRPSAAVVELPGLGHYPQVEAPKAYAEAALSLLVD